MAVGAIGALREAGRRVPEDVAVVGFDDSAAATMVEPALTTMRNPIEQTALRGPADPGRSDRRAASSRRSTSC